ncbi:MAG: hypothetical protein K2N63_03310 [Lachnospiraceae bacterium]|nr:hypothetical protein [Lachnospiraceae bacterium]
MNSERFSKAMGEVNNKYVDEAICYQSKKKNSKWIKWVVTAAACLTFICVVTINYFPPNEGDIVTIPGIADAAPMVCVNGKLYKQSTGQISYHKIKSEFIYLGIVESDVTNNQTSTDGLPKENFQANHPIVGAEVYQYNEDIVIHMILI